MPRTILPLPLVCAALLALGACNATTSPVSVLDPGALDESRQLPASDPRTRKGGAFPDFNDVPQRATTQMTDAERDALRSELARDAANRPSGGSGNSDAEAAALLREAEAAKRRRLRQIANGG